MYPREQNEATGGRFEWTRDKKSVRVANRFKIITHIDDDLVEFYDLEQDPLERDNLLSPQEK